MSALPVGSGDIIHQRRRRFQKPKVKSKCRHQPTKRKRSGRATIFDAGVPRRELILGKEKKNKKTSADAEKRRLSLRVVLIGRVAGGTAGRREEDSRGLVISVHPAGNGRRSVYEMQRGECVALCAQSHTAAARTEYATRSELMGYFFFISVLKNRAVKKPKELNLETRKPLRLICTY